MAGGVGATAGAGIPSGLPTITPDAQDKNILTLQLGNQTVTVKILKATFGGQEITPDKLTDAQLKAITDLFKETLVQGEGQKAIFAKEGFKTGVITRQPDSKIEVATQKTGEAFKKTVLLDPKAQSSSTMSIALERQIPTSQRYESQRQEQEEKKQGQDTTDESTHLQQPPSHRSRRADVRAEPEKKERGVELADLSRREVPEEEKPLLPTPLPSLLDADDEIPREPEKKQAQAEVGRFASASTASPLPQANEDGVVEVETHAAANLGKPRQSEEKERKERASESSADSELQTVDLEDVSEEGHLLGSGAQSKEKVDKLKEFVDGAKKAYNYVAEKGSKVFKAVDSKLSLKSSVEFWKGGFSGGEQVKGYYSEKRKAVLGDEKAAGIGTKVKWLAWATGITLVSRVHYAVATVWEVLKAIPSAFGNVWTSCKLIHQLRTSGKLPLGESIAKGTKLVLKSLAEPAVRAYQGLGFVLHGTHDLALKPEMRVVKWIKSTRVGTALAPTFKKISEGWKNLSDKAGVLFDKFEKVPIVSILSESLRATKHLIPGIGNGKDVRLFSVKYLVKDELEKLKLMLDQKNLHQQPLTANDKARNRKLKAT